VILRPCRSRGSPGRSAGRIAGTGAWAGCFCAMSDDEIYDDPSKVVAEDGVVRVKGPDAVDVKLTPEAADEISDRLFEGALQARGQQVAQEKRRKRRILGDDASE
jgi:hypothetical protein